MAETIDFVSKNGSKLSASFLSEDEQKAYVGAIRYFRNERARKTLNVPLKSSNLFKILLLNQIGIRTPTLSEMDQIIQADNKFLFMNCTDTPAVALRRASEKDYLANTLAKLAKKKIFNEPIVINGLELIEDNNSIYGLNFKKGKSFDYFEAPELEHKNSMRWFARQDTRGMPIFDYDFNKDITRILYTEKSGLARLYLCGNYNLSSNDNNLSQHSDDGRVVVIKEKK